MNNKILVERKNGYNIWGEVNPKNNKLQNFSVSGVGVNPTHTYSYITEAEKVVNKMIGKNN